MTHRVMNFGAGPAALPQSVLEAARDELLDFAGTGKSIMETSHRSPEYDRVHGEVQRRLKGLLGLDDRFHVLFFGGGASTQFTLLPMNLLRDGETADYLVTGAWAKKALAAAEREGRAHVAATTEEGGRFTRVPAPEEIRCSEAPAYVHLTSNNTIFGTQYHAFPDVAAPLVADMSSDLLWRPFDAARFGLIYAGAQKNLGPAGVTIVIVREDLLDRAREDLPPMFSYKVQAAKRSLYNTPPCFPIYMVGKVLRWIEGQGGLAEMERRNRAKGDLLYGVIDRHAGFYRAPVARESRSLMNVVFRLPDEALEQRFIAEAAAAGMVGIKGHRSVGGVRVSTYNAIPVAWVEAMADLMEHFVAKNG